MRAALDRASRAASFSSFSPPSPSPSPSPSSRACASLLGGALAVSLLALGCAPEDKSGGPGVGGGDGGARDAAPRVDGGPTVDSAGCSDGVDVVLVLDISSSMGFVIDELEANIGTVVSAANELAPGAHFGLIPFVDNFVIDATGPLEGGRVHTDASTLVSAFRHYRSVYLEADRNPADGPSGPTLQNPICEENALDALYAAAAEFPWRPQATRVIIVATDDTFLERPDNYGDRDHDGDTTSTDFPREGNYPALRTVAETVAALGTAEARVFSFTRTTPPGVLSRCGTGRRLPWADISDGWSTPYGGAAPIPESSGGRNFDLAQVQARTISLATTINDVVVGSHCVPID